MFFSEKELLHGRHWLRPCASHVGHAFRLHLANGHDAGNGGENHHQHPEFHDGNNRLFHLRHSFSRHHFLGQH